MCGMPLMLLLQMLNMLSGFANLSCWLYNDEKVEKNGICVKPAFLNTEFTSLFLTVLPLCENLMMFQYC